MKLRTVALMSVLIVCTAILRFVFEGFSNFAPITAIGIFCAFYFSKKSHSIIIALAALLVSDLILQGKTGNALYWQRSMDYIGFAIAIITAILIFKRKKSVLTIIGATLGASLIFFFISNFGVWLTGTFYPKSFMGLITCFEMGIPFYRGTFFGDILFTGVFFGSFEALKLIFPNKLIPARVKND